MSINKLIYFLIFFCISCNSVSRNKEQAQYKDTSQKKNTGIEQHSVPYVVIHYWDHINETDTLTLMKPEGAEQSLVDFLQLLPLVPTDTVHESINLMLEKAQERETIFRHFTELCEKYLYDPNSPMRNEKWYTSVLKYLIASPKIAEINKIKPRYQLKMIRKNMVGQVAEDFEYTTIHSNKIKWLHNIQSEYILLFFYNPDCDHCKEAREQLIASDKLTSLQINNKKLKVVAIYPYKDQRIWKNYASNIPDYWINGWNNEEIEREKTYDLRALPSFYLLDKDEKVLLKDAALETIEQFFSVK